MSKKAIMPYVLEEMKKTGFELSHKEPTTATFSNKLYDVRVDWSDVGETHEKAKELAEYRVLSAVVFRADDKKLVGSFGYYGQRFG